MISPKFYFRHDSIRNHQSEFMGDIHEAVTYQKILLAHAVTGLGKTDSVFAATLSHALENDLSIFFLTPKISQHKIAVDVVRGLSRKFDLNIRAVDMIGRRYACIDPSLSDLDHEGFYQSCEKKRKREECEFYGNARGYNPVGEAKANRLFGKMLSDYGSVKTHDELVSIGEDKMACPYEWMIKLASSSNIVIADYFHVMVPRIRELFMRKINKKMDKSIVIIDEAHNLASRIREQLSSTLNSFMLRRAQRELKLLGIDSGPIETKFARWGEGLCSGKREALVSKQDINSFLGEVGIEREEAINSFEVAGTTFIERTNRKSACLKIAAFLKQWDSEETNTIRILRNRGTYCSLSKRFLDPSQATSVLNDAHAAILMSGTLIPLEMHRDVLGLDRERTLMKKYASPFDPQNVRYVIAEGTTTRYSKRDFNNYSVIARSIESIIAASPPGVIIFFPSYVVLNAVVPLIKNSILLVQREKMNPREVGELLRSFRSGRGVLCAVQGGSISEGVDFCNEEIKTAIIVGIALEEMGLEVQALIDYYDDKYARGWEYGYTYPAIIKALQAAGRSIRKETDRAAIVFMDERFKWNNYKSIMDDGKKFIITSEPEKYVKEFWS